MVNRGRSGGCVTCKRRRVKCDEDKPNCQQCQRQGLTCPGYKTWLEFKFREQNYKFAPIEQGLDIAESTATVPRSLPAPDEAIAFYLRNYAGYGRNIEIGRGFFEVLIPVYRSQEHRHDSALSHAVSALASLVFSLWRHGSNGDNHNCRQPREIHAHAIASLRKAIAHPKQVNKLETLFAVLALQMYENVVAIYGLRVANRTHHDGALSLLPFAESDQTDAMISAYVRKFVLHLEVASALRRRKSIHNAINMSLRNETPTAMPFNPSMALDTIVAAIADLQAAHLQPPWESPSPLAQEDLKAEAKKIDNELLEWAHRVPVQWKSTMLMSGYGFDSSIPSYMGLGDNYASCQVANIWNLWRLQRLRLVQLALSSHRSTLNTDLPQPMKDILGGVEEGAQHQKTVQVLVDSVCRSIPFYLGNRTLPSSMADFTDPDIMVLPCPLHVSSNNNNCEDHNLGMASDEHRCHIIAQGPWHLMSPLSRLLTLLSESSVIASLLRPGQYQWIRAQFLRVMTLLHIFPTANSIGSDGTADFLAKQVRKGAMFMSGP